MDARSDDSHARARARLQQRQGRAASGEERADNQQSYGSERRERPTQHQSAASYARQGAERQHASQRTQQSGQRAARASQHSQQTAQASARAPHRAQQRTAQTHAQQGVALQRAGRAPQRAPQRGTQQQASTRQHTRAPQKTPSPYRPYIIGAICVFLVGILFGVFAPSCYSGPSSHSNTNKNVNQAADSNTLDAQNISDTPESEKPAFDASQVNRDLLDNLIGNARTDKLLALAETDEDAAWVLTNLDAYASFGDEIEYKLFKLMADDPNAAQFVRGCPEKWDSEPTGACDPVTPGTVPLLYQYDTRWSYYPYSRFVIGLSACGPTSVCMVYQGLTGDSSLTPYDIAMDAVNNNYVHGGTDAGFYYWEASHLGLTCEDLGVSSSSLRSALNDGCLVIINVGPGDFTEVGHFIVATGINGNQLTINDPFSSVRSAQTWDIDQVISQTKAMYCFSK